MRATCLTTTDDVADELERIGFKPDSADRYHFVGNGSCDKLYARIVSLDDGIHVNFSEKETFDRWANSTNFVVNIDPKDCEADIERAAKLACKICEAHAFDFNTYFHPIDLT